MLASCWVFVDRSDEVVIGTTERVVKAPNPAEAAEGEPLGIAMARIVSVPMVVVEHRQAAPVMKPRDYKARRFCIRRDVELAKYGFSGDCEGCCVALGKLR